MRKTHLILVEGIPGSGKSTLGQFVESQLAALGVPVTWWYEEQKGHPLYIFDDAASLGGVIADLRAGRFPELVDAALAKWRQFVGALLQTDQVVVLDSCLFGYLTWSLFPEDAPVDLIDYYVDEVEAIIRPCNPYLIFLHQENVRQTLARVGESRGREWAESLIRRATSSPYARRRGLHGFAGSVAYWEAYQAFAKRCFERLSSAKLNIDTSEGNWPRCQTQIAEFVDLPLPRPVGGSDDDLRRFVGTYADNVAREVGNTVDVSFENGELYASGLPDMWPRNRLIPAAKLTFRVASYPCDVEFTAAESGAIRALRLRGRELLSGRIDRLFVAELSPTVPPARGCAE